MSERALPADLVEGMNEVQLAKTSAWWEALNDGARLEFIQLWDERSEDTALFGTCEDGEITWHELPIELRGAFVDLENDVEHREAKQQLLEYIANHEDVRFFLVDRRFHICREHPEARALIRSGVILPEFRCPVADAACPMRAILDVCPGFAASLQPALARTRG